MAREPTGPIPITLSNSDEFASKVQSHLDRYEEYWNNALDAKESIRNAADPRDEDNLTKIRQAFSALDGASSHMRFAIEEIMKVLLANSRAQGGKRKSRRNKKSHHRKRRHTRRS